MKNFVVNCSMKRSLANAHLVNHAAKSPQVHSRWTDIFIKHLRRYIQRSANESVWLAMRTVFLYRITEERIPIFEVFFRLVQPLIWIKILIQLLAISKIRLQKNLVKKSMYCGVGRQEDLQSSSNTDHRSEYYLASNLDAQYCDCAWTQALTRSMQCKSASIPLATFGSASIDRPTIHTGNTLAGSTGFLHPRKSRGIWRHCYGQREHC